MTSLFRTAAPWLVLCMAMLLVAGCNPGETETSDVKFDLTLEPNPPVVGDSAISLTLTAADGTPLEGAEVKVEGNMNHAGMVPSFADLEETEPGEYSGTLDFTMGGDWFLLVTAKTGDGHTIEEKIDVPGVEAP